MLGVVAVVLAVGAMLGSAVSQCGQTPTSPIAEIPESVVPPRPEGWYRIRVEVLNSGGREGAALRATDYLRSQGVDVVRWGNDRSFSDSTTRVVDRIDAPDLAAWLATVMGVQGVFTAVEPRLLVEATIKIGPEWTAPSVPETPEPVNPWWDLRRYLR